MILTKINAYGCRDEAGKRHRKNFTINVIGKELFFLFDHLWACRYDNDDIQQRFDNYDDQNLNHQHLTHITSILHEVK